MRSVPRRRLDGRTHRWIRPHARIDAAVSTWQADPAALTATSDELTVLANQNDQRIADFTLALQEIWAQWQGSAAMAAQASYQWWLAQAHLSQHQLREAATCLQDLHDIYTSYQHSVQRRWHS